MWTLGPEGGLFFVLAAMDEHEDVRETVHRLESLVTVQGQEIRALRERLEGLGGA